MAKATCLIVGACSATPEDDIHFPSKLFVTTDVFTPVQVLNFGSLAFATNCYN